MTPYNTGKVKIGAAYTPRPRPEYSHGWSGPHKARFFDRVDRPVTWTCLIATVAFVVIVLSGCGESMSNDQVIAEVKKCHAAGMGARMYNTAWTPATTHVICTAAQP